MDPVIIVCGTWVHTNRYVFNADKRGCRVLEVNEQTTYNDLVQMVMEDYGLDTRICKIQLSYMFSNKILKKMSHDTPPVYVCNSRQFLGFQTLRKSDQLRLCVEVTENEDGEVIQKDKAVDKMKRPFSHVSKEEFKEECNEEYIGSYEDDGIYKDKVEDEEDVCNRGKSMDICEDKDEVEDEEAGEFNSRFDMIDDPDGASSDDDNFSLLGKPRKEDEDSPTLPPKKRPQNIAMNESKGSDEYLKFEMASLNIVVGQRYERKKDLEIRLKLLTVRDQFDFDDQYPLRKRSLLSVR